MLDFVAADPSEPCYFADADPDSPHDRERAAAILSPNVAVVVCRDCLVALLEAATGYQLAAQLAGWDYMRAQGAQIRAAKEQAKREQRERQQRQRQRSAR